MTDSGQEATDADGIIDCHLVLGADTPHPVWMEVTRAKVVDRDTGQMEIGLTDDGLAEFISELRLDEYLSGGESNNG